MDTLTIAGLGKAFGSQSVLDDLSFSVPEGSIYGFIGKNGSGKTTTMKIVLGLLPADAGEISVCGEKVHYGDTRTNRFIGYLPDVPEFYGFMTAKEYLSQAYRLDQRINSKLEQVASLNELATKCTSTLTGMPRNPNRSTSTMADAVGKIIDLQAEINRDIDRLVDLKREMVTVIKAVGNTEHQTLLELRYLCFRTWEQIAVDMGYSIQHIYRLREKAYDEIRVPTER